MFDYEYQLELINKHQPPFNRLMMFKILILQRYCNLSDEQTEFQLKDRLSFMQFLGLQIGDTVPDDGVPFG
jgi:IS5 family transposase